MSEEPILYTEEDREAENQPPQDPVSNEFLMHHNFNCGVANLCGMEAAVIFQHMLFWIEYNRRKNTNFREGTTWFYQSISEMQKFLFYLSPKQIKYAIQKLLHEKIIIKNNFNKNKFDRTPWYALSPEFSKNVFERPGLALGRDEPHPSINDSDKETDKEKEISAPDVADPFSFSSQILELSQSLLKNIRLMLPSFKEPNLKEWQLQIDRMIRIDKRTPEEIKKIIDWLPRDMFWSEVILSTVNLRKNFDKLCLAYKASNKNNFNPEEYVRKIFKSGEIYNNYECNISSQAISFTSILGQSHMQITFKEKGFLEQFENMCRKLKIKIKEDS
jgi:hypothetical protein